MQNARFQVATAALFAAMMGLGGSAFAQDDVDIEVPVLILDVGPGQGSEGDEEIDLANVVQSAAKGVTTVQEAPAIVTVITGDDIYERGFTRIDDVIDTVPGWLRVDAVHNQFPFGTSRGTVQSMLMMTNGVSLFSNWENTVSFRFIPIELVKRVEMITGPGGVLWGANSYLGIMNVITKDAEDVDGIETDVYVGDGPGERGVLKGYVMAGMPELLGDDISLLLHGSFETWEGPKFTMPQHLFSTPLPQPNSQLYYGPLTEGNVPRSMIFEVNAKANVGAANINVHAPIVVERHLPLGFPGVVIQEDLPEDTLDVDGMPGPDCAYVDPGLDQDARNPAAFPSNDRCVDRGRIARDNRFDFFERYVTLDYRTRFADSKAGATFKAYAIQFTRNFNQLSILAPTALLEGGLSFSNRTRTYRVGGSFDGDIELPSNVRLLYGAEAFRAWIPDIIKNSRQGAGTESTVVGPYDLSRLALACPFEPDPVNGGIRNVANCPLTMTFQTNRTVLGAYANPQWRPNRKLILDAGVRVQAAPDALGEASYPTQLIFSGAAVVNVAKDYHLKLNYAEGFRPPVFNNTDSNGESIQIDGSRDLKVENSRAVQAEINGRLFKGQRRLREVNFRLDYSYTLLENLIQIQEGGRYRNTADRGLNSVEFLGKIFLQGGHRLEIGYTWLKIATGDIGWFVSMPEHWFNVGGVFNLVGDKLQASTMLKVYGAMEDPNRIIEYRTLDPNPDPGTLPDENEIVVQPHELTLDRLPPAASLQAGLTWYDAFGVEALRTRVHAYNAFNSRYYFPDVFHSYEPRLEFLPNPQRDFRFIVDMNYTY